VWLPIGGSAPVTVAVAIPTAATLLLESPHVLTVTAATAESPAAQVTLITSVGGLIYLPLVLRAP
jgi:hypothetical protein